jgi:hypothetical protein
MSPAFNLLFVLASLTFANALDVELRSVSCDPDLPVTAEIYLNCNGTSRCTFGEPATVNGTCKSTNVCRDHSWTAGKTMPTNNVSTCSSSQCITTV